MFARVLMLLLLCACITPVKPQPVDAPASLKKIYNKFVMDAEKWGIPLQLQLHSIEFVDTETMETMYPLSEEDIKKGLRVIGLCVVYSGVDAYVYIIEDIYDDMTMTVEHELAHCLLNADHWELDVDIMNPILPNVDKSLLPIFEDKMFERLSREYAASQIRIVIPWDKNLLPY